MNIKITIDDSKISSSKIASGITSRIDEAEVKLSGTELVNSDLLSDININEFCSKCEQCISTTSLSKEEYDSLIEILRARKNRKSFLHALSSHLLSFTEGVVASIVATIITA